MQANSINCFVAFFENSGKQHNYKNATVVLDSLKLTFFNTENTVLHAFNITEITNFVVEDDVSISKDLIITLPIGDFYLQPLDDGKEYLAQYENQVLSFYNELKFRLPALEGSVNPVANSISTNSKNLNKKLIIIVLVSLFVIFILPPLVVFLFA